ncbi:ATP-grasp fold amidoligase family protein [Proteus terrae]|uniref:ATP-grasp fold amidoligase family protein n=1 Tax=Proteus terrae TaxID=1574161 RepID=UPI001BA83ECD|nr:ATP-grasp fold amidoligase family protein [Proteus terrae]QUT01925.1 glycosyl transferase [Proteus terrae subsp. cibarius]
MNKYLKILRNKLRYKYCDIFPELVTKSIYKERIKKTLNLDPPQTFNEKLQWLKLNLYKNNSLVTKCADKYADREYVKDCGCEEILNEIHQVWDQPDEINFSELPNKFVLKCNHGAGYNIICRNKDKISPAEMKQTLTTWLNEDYWRLAVEFAYKDIPKKIICEKFIETKNNELPYDYKLFCFNGKPLFVMICTERESQHPKFYFVNKEWELLPYGIDYKNSEVSSILEKPQNYQKLFEYAEKLSKPFPFVRVDLYLNSGVIHFGELTFIPSAGMDKELNNEENKNVDLIFGNYLKLN